MQSDDIAYRLIFENAVMGIYYSTPGGRHLVVNPALAQIYGYDSPGSLVEELTDIETQLYVDGGRRREFLTLLERDGELDHFESRVRRRDGSVIWISENARASRDADGAIRFYVGTVMDITQRKAAQVKLVAYQDALRSLASELALGEERERRRIATELHDGIAQHLALMKIKLGGLERRCDDPALSGELGDVRHLAEEAIAATRSLMSDISPPLLYEMGFEAAVASLAERVTERHGLPVRVVSDDAPLPLDEAQKVLLYQAVRELLMNVVKHAQASAAVVRLENQDGCLCVGVEDDGVGLPPSATTADRDAQSGFGLMNIRERLRHAGGRMEIEAPDKGGTAVRLRLPQDEDDNE